MGGLLQSSNLVGMLASAKMSSQNVLLGERVLANVTGVLLFFYCLCDTTFISLVGHARVAVNVNLSFLDLMRSKRFRILALSPLALYPMTMDISQSLRL